VNAAIWLNNLVARSTVIFFLGSTFALAVYPTDVQSTY